MSRTPPAASVVVATYERAALLPRLFAALEAQTLALDRFELVVVDDASGDRTPQVLAGLAARSRLACTVLRAARNGGPAAARNLGWRAARGEVVAFTDDDCVPAPGWLAAGLDALGAGAALVVGRTIPDPAQRDRLGAFSRTLYVEDARFMQTCNVFYQRATLAHVGGFDERLRTGEDTDLGLRVTAAAGPAAFAADALVLHDVRSGGWRDGVRTAWSWVDLPGVVKRHPGLRRTHLHRRVFWKPTHPPTLLALGGLVGAAATRRPRWLALALPWLRLRTVVVPPVPGRLRRLLVLPGVYAVDLAEVATMARGSARHRTLML